jgi:hypothetical protein
VDLFSGQPRLIHSLDLAAEDTDSESYRDLLREIDRAFQSFDHMAVRHGWLSGTENVEVPAPGIPTGIDLPAFVASVLAPAPNGHRVPPGWVADLHGLPGFDRSTETVRLTSDPTQFRDAQGRECLYPGRSHPLTQRAIAAVRTGQVSLAKADTLSLLVTYSAQVGSVLRKIFALNLSPDGSIRQQPNFLSFSKTPSDSEDPWPRLFAGWAPAAITAAARQAAAIAETIAETFAARHNDRTVRQTTELRAWLQRRGNEVCGVIAPETGDLFNTQPSPDGWRTRSDPEQRLSAFVADPSAPATKRH